MEAELSRAVLLALLQYNGGAIANYGRLDMSSCVLTNNAAEYWGGAMYIYPISDESSIHLILDNSELKANHAAVRTFHLRGCSDRLCALLDSLD